MTKNKNKSDIWKSFVAFLLAIPALMLISEGIKQLLIQHYPQLESSPLGMVLIGIVWLLAIYVILGYKKW